jgi:hypothetical protein
LLHAKAAKQQAEVAQQRAENDKLGRLTEVYAKSAEMFANGLLSVRLAGLYGLWDLARENPEVYHVRIMELLCAFICEPPDLNGWKGAGGNKIILARRPDVEAAISLIRERKSMQIQNEKDNFYCLNFNRADLKNANFRGAFLENAEFTDAQLQGADFQCADLQSANFFFNQFVSGTDYDKHLCQTDFRMADLRKTRFGGNWHPPAFPAIMKDAAINAARFPPFDDIDQIKEAVLLERNGKVLLGDPDFSIKNAPKLPTISIAKWEAEREKWRQENQPPATRR